LGLHRRRKTVPIQSRKVYCRNPHSTVAYQEYNNFLTAKPNFDSRKLVFANQHLQREDVNVNRQTQLPLTLPFRSQCETLQRITRTTQYYFRKIPNDIVRDRGIARFTWYRLNDPWAHGRFYINFSFCVIAQSFN
jgi:hypothetical protein